MTNKFPPPVSLNFDAGNLCQAWKKWKQQFKLFLVATESDTTSDKIRARETDSIKVDKIKEKFDDFCSPSKNITMLRHQFSNHRLSEGQRFFNFVTESRQLSEECEVGELKESAIWYLIICGLNDSRLRERMLLKSGLTSQNAIALGQAAI